jgi:tRNA pseudouridine65 synthase
MTPLRYLYQDEFLVAIDKPAGMIVHPGREPEGPEWIAMKRLRDELGQPVYPIHRLDRPTSGVLLFALDRATSTRVQQAFELRQVEKSYLAVVCGVTEADWCCEIPLRKSPEEPELAARTAFQRLAVAEGFAGDPELRLSLLRADPFTGRFHQIRRHLQQAGFPIVGDYRYAGRERSDELGAVLGTGTRMLLQAKSLRLVHPWQGGPLEIVAPPDEDFGRCFPSAG